jgi:hypothetical protein
MGTFLQSVAALFPELKVPEVLQMCLISLGINNVAEVMKAIEAKRAEIDAQTKINNTLALARAKAAANDPANKLALPSSVIPANPEEAAQVAALNHIGQVLREVYA